MNSSLRTLLQLTILFAFLANLQAAYAQLQADFKATNATGCSPLTVQFEDASNEPNLKYYWTFGNGNTSTKKNPQAIYYAPGKYEVSLMVTNSSLQTSTKIKKGFVEVFKKPTAEFSSKDLSGCAPHNARFSDDSKKGSGTVVQWLWDFGDGTVSNKASPNHEFQNTGKYDISLLVVDENKCQDKILKKTYIEVLPTPKPDMSLSKGFSCTVPFDVQFTDKSSGVSSDDTYLWDFGDGKTSSAKNPKHKYTVKGEYSIKLTITKKNGCTATKTLKNAVYIGDIVVDLNASPKEGCIPLEVSLISQVKPNIKSFTYKWDHGDGTNSIGFNSLHTYKKTGVYTLKLTVSDDGKCAQTVSKKNYIKVGSELVADFSNKDTFSCKIPHLATFVNQSKGGVNYVWKVESNEFKGQNMTYNFISYGKYDVTLVASNFTGCVDSVTKVVNIQPIKAKMWASVTEGCIPLEVDFRDMSNTREKIVEWKWDFDDGTSITTNVDSTSHTFNKVGKYNVTLTIKTENGCEASTNLEVKAGAKLKPNFTEKNDTLCNGATINFTNLTQIPDTIKPVEWQWLLCRADNKEKFSNSFHSQLRADADTGWYNVTLIANHNGCITQTSKDSQIYIPAPKSRYLLDYDTCKTDTVKLLNNSLMGTASYWMFSDGTKDTSRLIRYFPEKGKVLEGLFTIDTNTGCEHFVPVIIPAVERFVSANFDIVGDRCAPTTIVFKARNRKYSFDYQWTDHTGKMDSTMDVTRLFTGAGKYSMKLIVADTGSECIDSMQASIDILGPGIKGKVEGTPGCAPLKVKLTCDTKPDSLSEVYWLVGDEKVPVTQKGTIEHTILHPGKGPKGMVHIRLVGVDSNGCTGVSEDSIVVSGPKNISIDIGRFQNCESYQYILSPDFEGNNLPGLKYQWFFGDGDSVEFKVINHTYAKDGVYPLRLLVTDSFGCTSEWRDTINIKLERLNANLAADSITTDCPPHFVQFFDRSTAPNRKIESWFWDFEDGVTSTLRHPAHNYLIPGSYTVKLRVIDEWGCEDSIEYPNLILVNGPDGEYSFENLSGCVPVSIDFKSKNKDAAKVEWDFGDGTVLQNEENPTHIYKDTGRFIPLLVLTDSFGCTYTLPPIDTIYVYPIPEAGFIPDAICSNVPVRFENSSKDVGYACKSYWWFGDGTTDSTFQPMHQYPERGEYDVKLKVETEHGCVDSITETLQLKGIKAGMKLAEKNWCVGSDIHIQNNSVSDTTLASVKWLINGLSDSGDVVKRSFKTVGAVDVKLYVSDHNGCLDTLDRSDILVIGDTLPPDAPDWYRVTVEDDFLIRADMVSSKIPDFKAYHITRWGQPMKSIQILERTDTVLLDFGLNTLHNSYCYQIAVENTCGSITDLLDSPQDCSVEARANGGINHVKLDWSPYIGWNKVQTYNIHRERPSEPGVFDQIGSVPGDSLAYIDSSIHCETEHTYRIEAIQAGGYQQISWSDTCKAQPIYVNVVPPNKVVRATVENDETILIEWEQAPRGIQDVKGYLLHKSDKGTNYWQMGEMMPEGLYDLEDEEVEVDDRSYYYQMRVVDQCDDTSDWSNLAKTVLLKASTGDYQRPLLNWSKYEGWNSGVDHYEVQILEDDGSFTSLFHTLDALDTNWLDKITELNQRPHYCYRIIAYKNRLNADPEIVSVSNVDCAPVKSRLHVPNAFSPNGDGLNETFTTPGQYIKEYNIKIFNRWGELVFESDDMYVNWPGEYKGEASEIEAYLYVIETVGVDDVKRSYKGTVQVLR